MKKIKIINNVDYDYHKPIIHEIELIHVNLAYLEPKITRR